MAEYQALGMGFDPNLSVLPGVGLGDNSGFNPIKDFNYGKTLNDSEMGLLKSSLPEMTSTSSPLSSFNGFNQSQMKTDGSFGSIGAGVGALGGPVGSVIGGTVGTAVDMYMNYQANEERKRAERKRLEEARRQQIYAQRQAERDRAISQQRYDTDLGFRQLGEDRAQQGFDMDMKTKRVAMLQNAMQSSFNQSQQVRDAFAKRGVV